jgi:hypothetical protein
MRRSYILSFIIFMLAIVYFMYMIFFSSTKMSLNVQKNHSISTQHSVIMNIEYIPNEYILSSGQGSKGIQLWDILSNEEVSSSFKQRNALDIVYDDLSQSVIISMLGGQVQIWNRNLIEQKFVVQTSSNFSSIAAKNGYLFIGNTNGIVEIWDIKTGSKIDQFLSKKDYRVFDISVCPSSKCLLLNISNYGIQQWNISSKSLMNELTFDVDITSNIEFINNSDTQIIAGDDLGYIHIWNLDTRSHSKINTNETITNKSWRFSVNTIALIENGEILVAGTSAIPLVDNHSLTTKIEQLTTSRIQLWDIDKKEFIADIPDVTQTVHDIEVISDTSFGAAVEANRIIIWNIKQIAK